MVICRFPKIPGHGLCRPVRSGKADYLSLIHIFVGLTWQILVIFGMHWGFIPVYINNIMTLGYDNVMMPFFACTFATSAVVLAIYCKTKDKKLKEMAIPNFISGIFGVTEPAIYGILLPLSLIHI